MALDQLDEEQLTASTKGFFTTGVVVNKTGVRQSKNGKPFGQFKLCDLQKYDMVQVKKHLQETH